MKYPPSTMAGLCLHPSTPITFHLRAIHNKCTPSPHIPHPPLNKEIRISYIFQSNKIK